jgi:hypothetical protein
MRHPPLHDTETTYEVRGPYVSKGCPQWYVWEREGLQIPQVLSTHDSEQGASNAGAVYLMGDET